MNKSRFYYNHSSIYGWTVYDRLYHEPAYTACQDLLQPERIDESGTVCVSPVMLKSEYDAFKLCVKLNKISKEV